MKKIFDKVSVPFPSNLFLFSVPLLSIFLTPFPSVPLYTSHAPVNHSVVLTIPFFLPFPLFLTFADPSFPHSSDSMYCTTEPFLSALSAPFVFLCVFPYFALFLATPPPPGGSSAGGEEQFASRKPGPDGETQPVRLHRGYKQPGWTQTPPAADTTGATTGRNFQVWSCLMEEHFAT